MPSSSRRTFLRQATFSFGGLPFVLTLPGFNSRLVAEESRRATTLAKLEATGDLARSNPAKEGVAASGILDFLEAIQKAKFELHSFMMLRRGKVIAEGWWEPYGAQFVHTMYSMSKSFTSTAVGFAVSEGKLSVEDKVTSFFPDDLPKKISANLAAMRVKHLLTMSTGNEREPTGAVIKEENWAKAFLAQNFSHEPGSMFMYNSAASYMCSAIVQKVTGQTVLEYLGPRLFSPLAITNLRWETCPRGINTGGWGLSIQTEGLAKFGQFLLQKGQWEGKQLLPAKWIEEATTKHIQQPGGDRPDRPKSKNDWLQGYGYQFWRCQGTAFRGDGAFGQFTIVLPDQDAVVIMTSENHNLQGQLDLVWQHLLPACETEKEEKPNSETYLGLVSKLGTLKLEGPQGKPSSPIAKSLKGKTFKLEKNALGLTRASFAFDAKQCVFTAKAGEKTHTVECGFDSWVRGEAAIPGTPPRLIAGGAPEKTPASKIAATAAWTSDNTLEMRWQYYETPHHDTVTCTFGDGGVTITFMNSIAKEKETRVPIKGK
jgi:CubicO group peptidase (beta-lactamase class C family)